MYTLQKISRRFGVLALLLLASGTAIPQQASSRYTIEIVVFRTGSQTGALGGDARLLQGGGDDVQASNVAVRKLSGSASRLRGASGYRVLAHTAWTQNATGWNSRRGVSADRVGLAAAGITGKVILERGQYLHLGVDLTIDDGGRRYHISEVRRVKTDEAQYFDHPAIGVLAVVTPGG